MLTINQTIISALPGRQELFITREFDAPREKVFKAYSDAQLLTQWLGPKDFVLTVEQHEFRSGGAYQYVHTDSKGNQYHAHGCIHEVVPNERIIQTFEYDGSPEMGHVSLEKTQFESLPGDRTVMKEQLVFLTVADRDEMATAEMERDLAETFERLDELLANGTIQ